jgi:hypothetical protein
MSDALATLAADRPARHTRHHDRPFGVSVNLTHAKVAREPKPPAPRPTRAKPKQPRWQEVAPAIVREIKGRVLAIFSDYDGLWSAVRERVDDLNLTRLELDYLSGAQSGYHSKLLCGARIKKFGRCSLGDTLGAIGCKLALVEDEILTAKIRAIDHIIAAASAALGISRIELARLAGFGVLPPKTRMSEIDAALAPVGCRLALVEDSDATAKIMARCEQRKRPLRPLKLLPTAAKADQSHART